jgi:hypothetical protein
MEVPVKLTNSHLVLLSRATQRDDGALDISATLKDRQKIVGQLLAGKLVEEVPARGTLPVWRRDDHAGSLALIITNETERARHRAAETHEAKEEGCGGKSVQEHSNGSPSIKEETGRLEAGPHHRDAAAAEGHDHRGNHESN